MQKGNQTNGTILNYAVEGEGYPIVLIHGLATSLRDWETLVPDLVAAGFSVHRVDLFGHGDSPKPGAPRLYTFKVIYGTLDEWIDSLELEEPFFLVGHSMGGYMSLMYALRNPNRVTALTLIDPLFSLKQLPPFMINTHRLSAIGAEMLRLAPGRLVDTALGHGPTLDIDLTPQVRRRVVADVKRASPYILNIPSTLPDLSGELEKIQVPSQVIWGEQDSLLNPDMFPTMVAGIPYAVGHLIPRRGHQPHLDNPRVNNLVIDFFKTNMLSQEEMLAAFGEEGERLAWQYMLFDKYQTWFKDSFLAQSKEKMQGVFRRRADLRAREQKKAQLMEKAEMLIDELVDWWESTPEATQEQVEEAALKAQEQIGLQFAGSLMEEEDLLKANPHCENCDREMEYGGRRSEKVDTRLGVVEVERPYYRCPECGEEKGSET